MRRAVVLFKQNDLGRRKMLFESKNVSDVGLAKSINALSIITDDADILLLFGEEAYQCELESIRVLIFVDENVFIAVVVFFANLRRAAQKLDCFDQ